MPAHKIRDIHLEKKKTNPKAKNPTQTDSSRQERLTESSQKCKVIPTPRKTLRDVSYIFALKAKQKTGTDLMITLENRRITTKIHSCPK